MRVLAGMNVYTRKNTVNWWMRAWQNAEKYRNAKLLIVHTYDGNHPPPDQRYNIGRWKPDFYLPRKNRGQDIASFRDVLRARKYDPWDILFWAVDDNIPMRRDFLRKFVEPFEEDPKMGLVGNYWVHSKFYPHYRKAISDHFRTSCFAIRREVATQLCFPIKLESKWDCYKFEWLDPHMNLTAQVQRLGYKMLPVGRDWDKVWTDCNEYVWDIGCLHMRSRDPRCRRDLWEQYEAQFAKGQL